MTAPQKVLQPWDDAHFKQFGLKRNVIEPWEDGLRTQLDKVQDGLRHYVGGERILTDDQAPVEVLGMRAIDGLIQAELQYYQKIYREEGLKGLLAQF